MTYRTIRIAAACAALLVAALAIHAWLASRDDMERLQATLATQKQLLDAADARERARDTTLRDTLTQIAHLKRTTNTPEQIVRDLPKYLPLPQPITLASPAAPAIAPSGKGIDDPARIVIASESAGADKSRALSSPSQKSPPSSSSPASPSSNASRKPAPASTEQLPSAPAAQIPASDLKPLWDFVQDCRACQAQLAVARANAADDAQKIAALTRERDAAIIAAKGGSFWRRLRRNALWFAVGTGVGAAAYGATHR